MVADSQRRVDESISTHPQCPRSVITAGNQATFPAYKVTGSRIDYSDPYSKKTLKTRGAMPPLCYNFIIVPYFLVGNFQILGKILYFAVKLICS
jgi:hypothetical protein